MQLFKLYEYALITVEFFRFDKHLMKGFFGDIGLNRLTKNCFEGLLIHNFGDDVVDEHLGKPEEFKCLDDLRKRIYEKMKL